MLYTDALSQAYNRRYFEDRIRKKVVTAGIAMIDLDDFKISNDTYGHEYGDFAIVSIAKAMLKYCAADAIAARTGGDEFIVLEGAKDEMTGRLLAQKIRAELSEVQEKMQLPFQLSASIGAVVAQPGEENVLGSYIKQAEKLMYEEKAEKKVSRDN